MYTAAVFLYFKVLFGNYTAEVRGNINVSGQLDLDLASNPVPLNYDSDPLLLHQPLRRMFHGGTSYYQFRLNFRR